MADNPSGADPAPTPAPDPAASQPTPLSPRQQAEDHMLKAAQDAIAQLGDLSSLIDEAADAQAQLGASAPPASAAAQAPRTVGDAASPLPPGQTPQPLPLPNFAAQLSPQQVHALELLSDVQLQVKIELGRTRMLVEDVLKLSEGAVVELDKLAGDPVDVYVNNRHVARGEVLVLNDNFCVRINEVLAPSSEHGSKGVA